MNTFDLNKKRIVRKDIKNNNNHLQLQKQIGQKFGNFEGSRSNLPSY